MRTFMLMIAAAGLAVVLGCGNNTRDQYADAPPPRPRNNLYPLTASSQGQGQPMQGYAPTRISATPYGPDSYNTNPSAQVMTASYTGAGPGGYTNQPAGYSTGYAGQSTYPGPSMASDAIATGPVLGGYPPGYCPPGSSYCRVENVTANMNPIVPIGDPPVVVNPPSGGSTYMAAAYTPPLSASTSYSGSLGPYDTSSYGGTSVINSSYTPPQTGTSGGYGAYPRLSESPVPIGGNPSPNAGEYRLVPVYDVPPGNHPGDAGPSQWFEVVRPGNGPVRIGRMSATCVCVGVRIPKRQYAAGERVLIEARMLTKPPQNNLTYGIYVNIVEPVQTVVDADVTLRY